MAGTSNGRSGKSLGLSGRLFVLTILFVMLAEVLIYLPALSYYRRTELSDRIAAAHIAALVLETPAGSGLTPEAEIKVLNGVGVKFLAYEAGGVRNLLADGSTNPRIDAVVDLRSRSPLLQLRGTLEDLLFGAEGNIRVIGRAPGLDFVEILMQRELLHADMIEFSRIFFIYSLLISLLSALLLYGALRWLIVSPVLRLSRNVTHFASQPEDLSRVIVPSGRGDELGLTEEALAGMEKKLADELRQKRRLAELGLAVSKINHELRNILTTAQLLTDRLHGIDDDKVRRIAPRLVAVLGRAIDFCQATLAYGRVQEPPPQRRVILVRDLLEGIEDIAGQEPEVTIERDVPEGATIDADPEQMSRVIINLVRNSVQALAGQPGGISKRIRVVARMRAADTVITVADSGPGVPEAMKAKLFTPFHSDKAGNAAGGGTGLGLVIAAELVAAHGGTLALDDVPHGASFRITIPARQK